MTIQEAFQKSNKVRRTSWSKGYIYKDLFSIYSTENPQFTLEYDDIMATDWEPVIEKKKLCKALYKVGSSYIISAEYYETSNDVKHLGFIKLLPHTEIEV